MRRVEGVSENRIGAVFIAMSVDGFIATRDHGLKWLDAVQREGEDYGYQEFVSSIDAVLLGRRTFEIMQSLTSENPFQVPVYVASRSQNATRESAVKFQNINWVSSDLPTLFQQLRASGINRVYVDGGQLIQSALAHDLISEMCISVIPVLLGDGVPLFQGGALKLASIRSLQLSSAKSFESGLVQLRYKINDPHQSPGRRS